MSEFRAPGLLADWINGWLAALGVTVLVDGVRLRWTDDPVPVATFEHEAGTLLPSLIAKSLFARDPAEFAGCRLPRQAPHDVFRRVAEDARRAKDFSLAVSLTDLVRVRQGRPTGTEPSDFYVSGPGTVGTLGDRFLKCRSLTGKPEVETINRALTGTGVRVKANGLGFDFRRIAVGDMKGDLGAVYVDPVLECLAFFGLWLFPVRGNGGSASTRGWRSRNGGPSLRWPVWATHLDRWAIDALLGLAFQQGTVSDWPKLVGLGPFGAFESVRYASKGQNDPTRGFAGRRVL